MTEFTRLIERLCRISELDAAREDARCAWPDRIHDGEWCMSPELVSLYGTGAYEALSDEARRRLSLWEAVNFFSLNIHGERMLVAGIAHRLHRAGHEATSAYLHHFLDEENRHMALFAEFCHRYGGKIYPEKKFALERSFDQGQEDFLFFAKVFVFEEIVDRYNRIMAEDTRLAPVVRYINRTHHRDEARHLAFGRSLIVQLFGDFSPKWGVDELARVRADLSAYITAVWREYYNPDAYRDAGLSNPFDHYRHCMQDPQCRAHRRAFSQSAVSHLLQHGILLEEPIV